MRNVILKPNEEIVVVFRQSSAVLVPAAVLALVLIITPLWYAARHAALGSLFAVYPVWALLVVVWFLHKFFLWHREVYVISTGRFVKMSHESLFRRTVSETALDRVLNVSLRTTGPWSMLAGFGDIDVQVVGRVEPLVVRSVARPAEVKEFLWRLHEQVLERSGRVHGMQEFSTPQQKIVN